MVRAYESNMRFPRFRFKQGLWLGLSGFRFYHFIKEIAKGLGDMSRISMAQSAWDTLARLSFSLEADWQFDKEQIRGYPVLFYASHPSYIEPLLCLAALKDFDPMIVATGWLENISEPVSRRIIGIWDSKEATAEYVNKFKSLRRLLESVWSHILTYQVVEHLQGDISGRECASSRMAAIKEIIATLADGKPLFLFPSGGEAQKFWVGEDTRYFEKLLHIILSGCKRYPALENLRFVPMVYQGSLRALFQSNLWMPWHPLAFLPRLLPKKPFRFVMREFIALSDLIRLNSDTAGMTGHLMGKVTS